MSMDAKKGRDGRDCDITDVELVEMHRGGDCAAFNVLFARYDRRLRNWARSYNLGWGDRDDAYQEANLGFLKAVKNYKPEKGPFAAFARKCVERYLITSCRSSKTKKQEVLNRSVSFNDYIDDGDNDYTYLDILRDPNSPDPEDFYERVEFMRLLLNEASSCLSRLERASFILVILQGYRVKEAAEVLGQEWKKIDNAATRAKRKLADRLLAMPEFRLYLKRACS